MNIRLPTDVIKGSFATVIRRLPRIRPRMRALKAEVFPDEHKMVFDSRASDTAVVPVFA